MTGKVIVREFEFSKNHVSKNCPNFIEEMDGITDNPNALTCPRCVRMVRSPNKMDMISLKKPQKKKEKATKKNRSFSENFGKGLLRVFCVVAISLIASIEVGEPGPPMYITVSILLFSVFAFGFD